MSDLLSHRKKKKNLERPAAIEPRKKFEINSVEEEEIQPPSPSTKKKSNRSTSVRVSPEVQNKLNSLVNLGVGDNADTVIDILADEYIASMLSNEEKKQLKFMQDIYLKKRKNN